MKKILLFVVMIFSFSQLIVAQINPDSLRRADSLRKADSLKKVGSNARTPAKPSIPGVDTIRVQYLVKKGDTIKISIDSLKNSVSLKNCSGVQDYKALDFFEWLLVFVPLFVFLIIFFTIGKVKDFEFKNALTENEQTKKTIQNPIYTAANLLQWKDVPNLSIILPPTLEVSSDNEYRPSISRYIAFISSILTLIVALSMSCFFIYHYIRSGEAPELSSLSVILIALGIGVAPYAFNKVSGAISSNK